MRDMPTKKIDRSGISASAIGLGTWAIGGWMRGGTDETAAIAAIQAAIDEGVTLIDTAPAYGMGRSEEIVGRAIKRRRDKVVLSSKCGLVWHVQRGNYFFSQQGMPVHRYLGRDSIRHEVEESLRRRGTDYIDNPDQARENAGAGRIRISPDDLFALDAAVKKHLSQLDG